MCSVAAAARRSARTGGIEGTLYSPIGPHYVATVAGPFVDIRPLREFPEFRRLWLAFAFSATAYELSVVAIAYETYKLTGSSLDVGLISLVQLLPGMLAATFAGPLADAIDRKTLLVMLGSGMAVCSIGLGFNAQGTRPSLSALFLLAGVVAGLQGANAPTQVTIFNSLVDHRSVVAANSLRQIVQQFSRVVGPALGGVLIAVVGLKLVFWLNVLPSLVGVCVALTLHSHLPEGGVTSFGVRSLVEGLAFVRAHKHIEACILANFSADVLGMPTALFPALAVVHFHGGARAVGLLYAAPGLGALIASMVSGWTARIRRLGVAVCVAIGVWGLSIAIFGLTPWLPLALVFLAVAGGADVISAVFRSAITQSEVPDRLRGRVSSLQQLFGSSGPRLGNAEAGVVAALSSAQVSVLSGGLASVAVMAALAWRMPALWRYRLEPAQDVHA